MRSKTARSIALALLMIVSVQLPMFDAEPERLDLEDTALKEEAPPSPCQGHDACRGSDAGRDKTTAIDLTSDFDWTGANETNVYYGTSEATSYSASADANYDMYLVDPPMGYGVLYELEWNHSSPGSYSYGDTYAYRMSIGPGDGNMVGWSYSTSATYGGAWGYCYYSNTGYMAMSTTAGEHTSGNPPYCYFASTSSSYYPHAVDFPHDLAGDPVMASIYCYRCYQNSYDDYKLTVTVYPGDAGGIGDETSAIAGPDQPWNSGSTQIGSGWWSSTSDSFTLAAGDSIAISYTCDYWCASETSMTVSGPGGASYSYPVGTFGSYSTGTVGPYSGAGTWTVTMADSYGDGGMQLTLNSVLGTATGMLTGSLLDMEAISGGIVGSTDTSDMWAIVIPDGFSANITLDWDQNADLDLYVWTTSSGSGLIDYSWYDQPEFIDLGGAYANTTVWVEVEYYSWYSVSSFSGYSLWLQLAPSENPPCYEQNDGGGGDDAADASSGDDVDPLNMSSLGSSGTFTGMACKDYDDNDWYAFDLQPYEGMWARLDWPKETGEETMYFYQYFSPPIYGYQYTASSSTSTYFQTHAVSTNESFYFTSSTYAAYSRTVWLNVRVNDLPDDYELNYTVEFSIYNQSAFTEPTQDDAGSGGDAGDSTSGYDATTIVSMNNTYSGWGHDYLDRYDYYKIYVPENYGLTLTLSFPVQDDYELYTYYQHPVYGYLYSIAGGSSYNYNPEVVNINFGYGGQDIFIRVYADRGGGNYDLDVVMLTADNAPGSNQDDCGIGIDAADSLWTMPEEDTWMNGSTAIDANGDANDTGGSCTGWVSYVWDKMDVYKILVPAGKYIMVNISTPQSPSTTMLEGRLYQAGNFSAVQGGGTAFYVDYDYYCATSAYNGDGCELSSGLYPVSGNWVWLEVDSYTSSNSNVTYSMDIVFDDLANLPGGIQNDAGSGQDAGSGGVGNAVDVNLYNNMTNNTMYWEGWNHASIDDQDWYSVYVPNNMGFEVTLSHGYAYPTVWMILYVWTESGQQITFQGYNNPNGWNSSMSTHDWSDSRTILIVRNYYYDNTGTDYNVTVNFYSLDTDGDGWRDTVEDQCQTDPLNASSVPADTDADGICDYLDDDDDGDGIADNDDAFPTDPDEQYDDDGDGVGNNNDTDLDGDNWTNDDEILCLTDMYDPFSVPLDTDGDTVCDVIDTDDDNDGVMDDDDMFPLNASEWGDNDFDGIGDNADTDDDNDGFDDATEIECLSDPFNVGDIPMDQDLDGTCDAIDSDVDGDGYDNDMDAFPLDPNEWIDTDGDGVGDNADTDDDNDLVLDVNDAFPLDAYEWIDTDGDGVGNNADLNDDGDAWTDAEEAACGSDSLLSQSVPPDYDGDGLCDKVDTDDDGDGVDDANDAFPFDATEFTDLDGDGIGDFSDTDDDNDGWLDIDEPNCGTDPMDALSVPADNDRDWQCDPVDQDDDNDGTIDVDDDFPMNPDEQNDLDGDGIGDNTDADDDGDDWLDITENLCAAAGGQGDPRNANVMPIDNETNAGADGEMGTEDDFAQPDGLCNALDPDDDNDGVPDAAVFTLDANGVCTTCEDWEDHFPYDPTEAFDANGDGQGDNGAVPSFLDNVKADTMPFAAAGVGLLAALYLVSKQIGGRDEDDEYDEYDETDQFEDDDIDDLMDEEDSDEESDEDED